MTRTYPRSVKQMLIKRSAPHPATANTPTGGTIHCQLCIQVWWKVACSLKIVMRIKKTALMTPILLDLALVVCIYCWLEIEWGVLVGSVEDYLIVGWKERKSYEVGQEIRLILVMQCDFRNTTQAMNSLSWWRSVAAIPAPAIRYNWRTWKSWVGCNNKAGSDILSIQNGWLWGNTRGKSLRGSLLVGIDHWIRGATSDT